MANSSDHVSMALFCDFENVALGVRDTKYQKFDIRPVLERLLLKGSIVVKKAYCDWDRYKDFKAPMHEANFELIEIPHVRQSGKNSADIRLVVDALDFCYTKSHVNTFVIISGDSDFSPLVSKLRENDKTVIGVGVKQSTSDLLVANCDEFIFYDDLAREMQREIEARRDPRGQTVNGPRRSAEEERLRKDELEQRRTRAVEMVSETFEALMAERGDSGKIWASVLKDALKRRRPDFNEAYFGFRAFGNLLEEAQSRGLLEVGRAENSSTYVYRSGAQLDGERAVDVAPAESGGRENAGGRQASRRGSGRRSVGSDNDTRNNGGPAAARNQPAASQTDSATEELPASGDRPTGERAAERSAPQLPGSGLPATGLPATSLPATPSPADDAMIAPTSEERESAGPSVGSSRAGEHESPSRSRRHRRADPAAQQPLAQTPPVSAPASLSAPPTTASDAKPATEADASDAPASAAANPEAAPAKSSRGRRSTGAQASGAKPSTHTGQGAEDTPAETVAPQTSAHGRTGRVEPEANPASHHAGAQADSAAQVSPTSTGAASADTPTADAASGQEAPATPRRRTARAAKSAKTVASPADNSKEAETEKPVPAKRASKAARGASSRTRNPRKESGEDA